MANEMKKADLDALVRDIVVEKLGLNENGTRIGTSTYAVSAETPEGVFYGKVAITAALRKATAKNEAFDLDTAVAKYEDEVAAKAAKAAEKAAEKAAKAAKAEKVEG